VTDAAPEYAVTSDDARFMRRALTLAARARTHPNPMVGAIVVRDGRIVGEGWHRGYINGISTDHAETMAFADAGDAAQGATVYVTLEPCAHRVRSDGTPRTPCAERCIRAGALRVVAAMQDPDERVSGQGFAMLRAAGIVVNVGVEEAKARALNRAYIRQRTTGLPYITHKAAMTLDGKIAAAGGDSQWITGEAARAHVHRLRHRVDAIVTGIGTVLADNPRMTTRLPHGNGHDPLRVIIDSNLRLPTTAAVARPGTLIFTTESADKEQIAALSATGAEIVAVPATAAGRVEVTIAAQVLAERGLYDILLESGGALASSFWNAGLVNRALFFIAPKIIGGADAATPIDGAGISRRMAEAVRLKPFRVRRFGSDIALEAEVDT
jgi:diaminohydroxyphosphoribosylaminopyrimidine deaminase / 5-amino-6-(5-phosphoribosylamino)uracil reductase